MDRCLRGALTAIAIILWRVSFAADGNAPANSEPIANRQLAPQVGSVAPANKLWVCPMHPQVVQNHPGTCPICGMDLVEMSSANVAHRHAVRLDTATLQKLGVRVATATVQSLSRDIATYGTVTLRANQQFVVTSKVEGIIRKLNVSQVGQAVKAGEVLYEIDSLDLLQTQREYIALLREKDAMVASMTRGEAHGPSKGMTPWETESLGKTTRERMRTREKLLYADIGENTLARIDRTYQPIEVVPIPSTRSGFVTEINVREGSVVKPMDNIVSIANVDKLWVEVALYPDQLPWVRDGDLASIKLSQPDPVERKGRVQIENPLVDDPTRTVRARIAIENRQNRIRVGSYVDVTVYTQPHKALVVPRSAVLRSGKGDWIMRSEEDGYFVRTKVQIGIETEDSTEIVAGLKEGDQVAVNGQFLLDSAAQMGEAGKP